ncbi:polysaccharide deacetylase family protein [Halobacterium zhouii]|uniref:polysaccharide deacetylase family protein n=1 Tax=Halobacterium zhouii TaxID=2902624 RepID=UPI001E53CF8D|nr:polysaccharide deacetylase family protein [Halobacterium zhouii]
MGTVVISVDAELGWGFHDLANPPARRVAAARGGWQRLLSLFDAHDVPATWAVVGHLFERHCDRTHADHPLGPDWFRRERGSWRDRPDLRFGRGLITDVRDADVGHELASHTYSHVQFGDVTRDVARAEVEASVAAAREFGVDTHSFVFPRNNVAHQDVLADAGIRCYRGANPSPASSVEKLRNALVDSRSPPLVHPERDEHGLVNVPASLFLYGFEDRPRDIVTPVRGDPILRQVEAGLDAAASDEGVLHLWLHPNNLVDASAERRMNRVLTAVAAHRDAGDVTVETMQAVAERTASASSERAAAGRTARHDC